MDRREGKRWAWLVRKSVVSNGYWGESKLRGNPAKERFPLLSPLWFIACQRLPHIGLGNPELSRNPCWRDARLEGGANGVHLAMGQ